MINTNDFKTGLTITYEGNLYQVLEFQHVKPGKGAAIVKTKLKNLRTGTECEGFLGAPCFFCFFSCFDDNSPHFIDLYPCHIDFNCYLCNRSLANICYYINFKYQYY